MENSGLKGKNVSIFFDDLSIGKVGRKDAVLVDIDADKIVLNANGFLEIIPLSRIIRIAEQRKGGWER